MNPRPTVPGVLPVLIGAALALLFSETPATHRMGVFLQGQSGCGAYCGTERWGVKTLNDADRNKVDFEPQEATVGWLVSQHLPAHLPADRRVAPIETQTYRVRARLVGYKLERDEDLHVVIADMADRNKTMIVEIPSPECAGACASGHTDEFRKARTAITETLGPATEEFAETRAGVTVVVTGVGFFDFLHGQTGAAPNGVELHPILKIEFESDRHSTSMSPGEASTEVQKSEIKVWVNTNSGVYHCPSTRWYGATRHGKYLGECEARKAGYRAAYNRTCGSTCQ